jgi:hypothetical protein
MSDKEKEFDDVVDVLRVKYTEDGWLDSELVNETIKAFKQAKLILPDVSQQRELLVAWEKRRYSLEEWKIVEKISIEFIDDWLSN